jgi:hypothetical protein
MAAGEPGYICSAGMNCRAWKKLMIKKIKIGCIDTKAGTEPPIQNEIKVNGFDFITPPFGVVDGEKSHINIDWTSGGLEAMKGPKFLTKIAMV